jgi:hypothetical protein
LVDDPSNAVKAVTHHIIFCLDNLAETTLEFAKSQKPRFEDFAAILLREKSSLLNSAPRTMERLLDDVDTASTMKNLDVLLEGRVAHYYAEFNNRQRQITALTTASKRTYPMRESRELAEQVALFLGSSGMSQEAFAETVGTNRRTLGSFLKTGRARPDIFDAIATSDIEYLCNAADYPRRNPARHARPADSEDAGTAWRTAWF